MVHLQWPFALHCQECDNTLGSKGTGEGTGELVKTVLLSHLSGEKHI